MSIELLPFVLGCIQGEPESLSFDLPPINQNFVHDVGTLVSGQVILHEFVFVNRTDEAIALADGKAKRTCACSAVKVTKTRLAPGERAEVTVSVDTRGRVGRLHAGGKTSWIGDSGLHRANATFFVEGLVETGLRCEPSSLEFDEEDIRRGVMNEIAITSPLKVDWRMAHISTASPSFSLDAMEPSLDSLRILVSCKPSKGVPEVIGTLDIEVPVIHSGSAGKIPPLTATFSLHGRQRVPFSVTPRQAVVNFASKDNRATLQFLVLHTHECVGPTFRKSSLPFLLDFLASSRASDTPALA